MSVVVVIKDKDRVYVGCDTRMSSEDSYTDGYRVRPKMFKLENGYVVAGVGNIGLVDIAANKVLSLKELNRNELLYKVALPMFNELRDTPFIVDDGCLDCALAIASGTDAYIIDGNGSIDEIHNYSAIGSGKLPALGSIYSNFYRITDKEEMVVEAIIASGTNVKSVSKQAIVCDTKSQGMREYDN